MLSCTHTPTQAGRYTHTHTHTHRARQVHTTHTHWHTHTHTCTHTQAHTHTHAEPGRCTQHTQGGAHAHIHRSRQVHTHTTNLQVKVELLQDHEGLLAVWTPELLRVIVHHHVLLEVCVPLEVRPTLLAHVGPLPGVDPHVNSQPVGPGKGGPAVFAHVGLVACVGALVDEEGGVLGVGGATHIADVGPLIVVGAGVVPEVAGLAEGGATLRAVVLAAGVVDEHVQLKFGELGEGCPTVLALMPLQVPRAVLAVLTLPALPPLCPVLHGGQRRAVPHTTAQVFLQLVGHGEVLAAADADAAAEGGVLGFVHFEGEEGVEDGVADLAGEEDAAVVPVTILWRHLWQVEVDAEVHSGARHLLHGHCAS